MMHNDRSTDRSGYMDRVSVIGTIPAERVYVACGRTDMRLGIDGLAAIVQQTFRLDPCSRCLFLFCGRRGDRIKALFYEGDGFVLLYKRLERGVYQWPRGESEAKQITERQLRWLLEGLSMEQPKALSRVGSVRVV
jgi:transposase